MKTKKEIEEFFHQLTLQYEGDYICYLIREIIYVRFDSSLNQFHFLDSMFSEDLVLEWMEILMRHLGVRNSKYGWFGSIPKKDLCYEGFYRFNKSEEV